MLYSKSSFTCLFLDDTLYIFVNAVSLEVHFACISLVHAKTSYIYIFDNITDEPFS